MFKVFDYQCEPCKRKILDLTVEDNEVVTCRKCGGAMVRLFPCPKMRDGAGEKFQPFWSDTFQMRVNDREDMKKVRELRKKHGLECIGHNDQKADRKAIKHNYESE